VTPPRRAARAHRRRRTPAAIAIAAVLATVFALVPDPVTTARAPQAYQPIAAARFTEVSSLAALADTRMGTPEPLLSGPATTSAGGGVQELPLDGPVPQPVFTSVTPQDLGTTTGFVGQIVRLWSTTEVSWYGPGFYGKRTACGYAMSLTLVGVAHRTLPCGTLVQFRWAGHTVTAPVVDRGPYVAGRIWDLTYGLCALLDHCYTGPITWRIP
jgi:hypothetical protein